MMSFCVLLEIKNYDIRLFNNRLFDGFCFKTWRFVNYLRALKTYQRTYKQICVITVIYFNVSHCGCIIMNSQDLYPNSIFFMFLFIMSLKLLNYPVNRGTILHPHWCNNMYNICKRLLHKWTQNNLKHSIIELVEIVLLQKHSIIHKLSRFYNP